MICISSFLECGASFTHNATQPLSDITGGFSLRLLAASSVATKNYFSQTCKHTLICKTVNSM